MPVKLKFNRTWSVPQDEVADDIVIAAVPARPSFDDMLETCRPFGTGRVRAIFEDMRRDGELGRFASEISGWMPANIERGFAKANRPQAG
jgi:hypothetical protein